MKLVIKRLRAMCPESAALLKGGLMVASTLVFCSIILLFFGGTWSLHTHYILSCSAYLRELAPAILFITVFGSAWWEERKQKMENK